MPRKKKTKRKTTAKKKKAAVRKKTTARKKKAARKSASAKKKTTTRKKKKTARKKTATKKKTAKKKKKTAGKKKKTTARKKKAVKKAAPAKKKKKKAKKKAKKKMSKVTDINKKKKVRRKKSAKEDFTPYQAKRGEDYMNKEQRAHFRQILENWKQELLDEVERTVHHMRDEAANFPDPNDRATQEEEFALELRTRDRERKLIKKINESLTDIDNGDYGYCEICGVEIGIRRLEARPTATLCIDCKTLDEIKERHLG